MKSRTKFKILVILLTFILVSGIVNPLAAFADKEVRLKISNDVQWVNDSDEYKLCTYQAYLNAMNRLQELAAKEKPGTWCVVLDADETVISNVGYQKDLLATGEEYSSKSWIKWGKKAKARAVPGAVEFCKLVKKLNGKVIIVTNRKHPLREPTMKNLDKLGVPYDAVILREGPYKKDKSKVMRRADVEKGTIKGYFAKKKLPPLKILMLAGDQTHDLYDNKKYKFEDIKANMGKNFIALPNPMYGSWQWKPSVKIKSKGSPETVIIKVKVGEEFIITLDSNRTTGYSWQLANPIDKDILKLVGTDYEYSEPDKKIVGKSGKSIWTFMPIGKGRTAISLKYSRPWDMKASSIIKKVYFVVVE